MPRARCRWRPRYPSLSPGADVASLTAFRAHLIRSHLEALLELSAESSGLETQASTLRLLRALASLSPDLLVHVFRRLPAGFMESFAQQLRGGSSAESIALRHASLGLLQALYGAPNALSNLYVRHPAVPLSLFAHLSRDVASVAIPFVVVLRETLQSRSLSTFVKSVLCGLSHLPELLRLFESRSSRLREETLRLLRSALVDPSSRILNLSFSASGEVELRATDSLARLLFQLNAPGDPLQAQLALELFEQYPVALTLYLERFPFALAPRFTPRWLSIVTLLLKLLPRVRRPCALPPELGRGFFAQGLYLAQPLGRFASLLVLRAVLRFMSVQLRLSRAAGDLSERFLAQVPDVQAVYALRSTEFPAGADRSAFQAVLFDALADMVSVLPALRSKARFQPQKLLEPLLEGEGDSSSLSPPLRHALLRLASALYIPPSLWIGQAPLLLRLPIDAEGHRLFRRIREESGWRDSGWEDALPAETVVSLLTTLVRYRSEVLRHQQPSLSISLLLLYYHMAYHPGSVALPLVAYATFVESLLHADVLGSLWALLPTLPSVSEAVPLASWARWLASGVPPLKDLSPLPSPSSPLHRLVQWSVAGAAPPPLPLAADLLALSLEERRVLVRACTSLRARVGPARFGDLWPTLTSVYLCSPPSLLEESPFLGDEGPMYLFAPLLPPALVGPLFLPLSPTRAQIPRGHLFFSFPFLPERALPDDARRSVYLFLPYLPRTRAEYAALPLSDTTFSILEHVLASEFGVSGGDAAPPRAFPLVRSSDLVLAVSQGLLPRVESHSDAAVSFLRAWSRLCPFAADSLVALLVRSWPLSARILPLVESLSPCASGAKELAERYAPLLAPAGGAARRRSAVPALFGLTKSHRRRLFALPPEQLLPAVLARPCLLKKLLKRRIRWSKYVSLHRSDPCLRRLTSLASAAGVDCSVSAPPESLPLEQFAVLGGRGYPLALYRPFLSHAQTVATLQLAPNRAFGEYLRRGSPDDLGWLLDALDPSLLSASVAYSAQIRLSSSSPVFCELASSPGAPSPSADRVYDPLYVLPLLRDALGRSSVDPKRWVCGHLVGYLLSFLSSPEAALRAEAYACMPLLQAVFDRTRHPSRLQLRWVLTLLRNSVSEANARLPSLLMVFLGDALPYLLLPSHSLYPVLNRYLISRCALDLRDVPLFYDLFNSYTEQYKFNRGWMLRTLLRGLQSAEDYTILSKRHVLPTLFAFYESPVADSFTRLLALRLLLRAVSFAESAKDLYQGGSLLPFLHGLLLSSNRAVTHFWSALSVLRACLPNLRGSALADAVPLLHSALERLGRLGPSPEAATNALLPLSEALRSLQRRLPADLLLALCDAIERFHAALPAGTPLPAAATGPAEAKGEEVEEEEEGPLGADEAQTQAVVQLWVPTATDARGCLDAAVENAEACLAALDPERLRPDEVRALSEVCLRVYLRVCSSRRAAAEESLHAWMAAAERALAGAGPLSRQVDAGALAALLVNLPAGLRDFAPELLG